MSPTPNTTFFRDAARCGHFSQTNARVRNSAMAACFAWGSSGVAPCEAGAADASLAGGGDPAPATGGAAVLGSNKGNAGVGRVGGRLGFADAALDSRIRG